MHGGGGVILDLLDHGMFLFIKTCFEEAVLSCCIIYGPLFLKRSHLQVASSFGLFEKMQWENRHTIIWGTGLSMGEIHPKKWMCTWKWAYLCEKELEV